MGEYPFRQCRLPIAGAAAGSRQTCPVRAAPSSRRARPFPRRPGCADVPRRETARHPVAAESRTRPQSQQATIAIPPTSAAHLPGESRGSLRGLHCVASAVYGRRHGGVCRFGLNPTMPISRERVRSPEPRGRHGGRADEGSAGGRVDQRGNAEPLAQARRRVRQGRRAALRAGHRQGDAGGRGPGRRRAEDPGKEGETVAVGAVVAKIDTDAKAPASRRPAG